MKRPVQFVIIGIVAVLAFQVTSAGTAAAQSGYRNDLNLSNLYNAFADDPARNQAYRSLMSQMGMVFAPMFHSPAETTGYSGFAISAQYGITTIDDQADYWRNGLNRAPQPVMNTLSLQVRKGVWIPAPSFELGAGMTYLVDSRLFGLNAFAKFSLHEDFHKWPSPAIAARFQATRIFGTSQVDMTVLSFDVSASKSFGVGGVMNFTPYGGYNALWIIADSQVIDTTPGVDSLQCSIGGTDCQTTAPNFNRPIPNGQFCTSGDCGRNYVFDDQSAILRHRFFLGLRIIAYHVVITLEGAWSLKGSSADTLSWGMGNIKDRAKVQQTYSFSLGYDY
jgi:hypothetical protein